MKGILYLVSTPIGNLEDITVRALRVLKDVHVVVAEDPGCTEHLFRHHGIDTSLTSYHGPQKEEKTAVLIKRLEDGQAVALVSDAGTPLVSDPGAYLITQAIKAGIRIVPIPGPSSAVTALSASGMPADSFVFQGFLPRKGDLRRRVLNAMRTDPRTHVLFESAVRLDATLAEIISVLGNRRLVLACNLTGPDEEFLRGPAKEVRRTCSSRPVQGEVTLVVKGGRGGPRKGKKRGGG